jgi:lycopene cyclase domain-containing protein
MTYAGLALLFVGLSAAVAVTVAVVRRLPGRWWLATAVTIGVMLALTVVFDSLMIISDLFRFDESSLLGVHLWHAPLEDLAWPLAAGLLLPALRELLDPRETSE